jgi:hypothetical protein
MANSKRLKCKKCKNLFLLPFDLADQESPFGTKYVDPVVYSTRKHRFSTLSTHYSAFTYFPANNRKDK